MNFKGFIISLIVVGALGASAKGPADVQSLLDAGEVERAIVMADSLAAAQPKSGDARLLLGRCLLQAGRTDEAEQAFNSARQLGEHESMLALAEIEANRYQIEKAESLIDDYKTFLTKNKRKKLRDNSAATVEYISRIDAFLDRVEKIQVIDSLIVDKKDFFEAYLLSPESGSINTTDMLPDDYDFAIPTSVYLTEDGREMIWAADDKDAGRTVLCSTDYLSDGSWEAPMRVGDHLGLGGNANYPFLMPDGITLYFASDCEESLGGYDIFISRNNGSEFLQPQNIGMPYNSRYDDYLLAIDEMNGVGWWATDRNQIEGKITIYIFIPSDLRINVDRSDPTLADRAMLTSIKTTQDPSADYSSLLARVKAIIPPKSIAPAQFEFAMPDGRVLTRFSDFESPQARESMGLYLDIRQEISDLEAQLAELRRKFADGDTDTSREILYLERDLLNARADLARVRNDVIRAETY